MKVKNLDTDKTYTVQSSKNPSQVYEIAYSENEWKCTCPAFMYRKDLTKPCKHIKELIEKNK